MDNKRAREIRGLSSAVAVLESETLGQLEVELNGGALMATAQTVADQNINLGSVESTILGVDGPWATEAVKGISEMLSITKSTFVLLATLNVCPKTWSIVNATTKETKHLYYLLGNVPLLNLSEELLRAGGKSQGELESENTVDVLQEVEGGIHLSSELVETAEQVSIVLLETTDTGQTAEGSRGFVTVKDTEIGETEGELTVRTLTNTEHQAVSRAVHGLESKGILLNGERKHVLLVVLPMSRSVPQLDVVHVGRHNLSVSALVVLALDEVHKGVVDTGSVREEEARTGGEIVEEEQLLLLSNLAMVTLGGLLQELLVLSHLLGVGEGDTIDTLKRVVLGITQEVRSRVLIYHVN